MIFRPGPRNERQATCDGHLMEQGVGLRGWKLPGDGGVGRSSTTSSCVAHAHTVLPLLRTSPGYRSEYSYLFLLLQKSVGALSKPVSVFYLTRRF